MRKAEYWLRWRTSPLSCSGYPNCPIEALSMDSRSEFEVEKGRPRPVPVILSQILAGIIAISDSSSASRSS
jgi:hypothetical protein